MGAMLVQEHGMQGCFSQKANSSQLIYTMTEKELLAIAKGLKCFHNIIFGYKIVVHSYHMNLCHGDNTKHINPYVI